MSGDEHRRHASYWEQVFAFPFFLRVMLEMGDIDDAWLKDRILWAARKNGLPVGMTSFVDATRTNCPEFALSACQTRAFRSC